MSKLKNIRRFGIAAGDKVKLSNGDIEEVGNVYDDEFTRCITTDNFVFDLFGRAFQEYGNVTIERVYRKKEGK